MGAWERRVLERVHSKRVGMRVRGCEMHGPATIWGVRHPGAANTAALRQ